MKRSRGGSPSLPRLFGATVRFLLTAARVAAFLLSRRRPEDLLSFFADLGGCWVKLGQALALRYDLLDAEYCEALYGLFETNPSEPFAQIGPTLPPATMAAFAHLEPVAFASGSIAQVHRGRLHDGTLVAVKIRHTYACRRFTQDLTLMGVILRWASRLGLKRIRSFNLFFEEFREWTLRELDFSNEVFNCDVLAFNADESRDERYPKIYREISSTSVLVMEFVSGVGLSAILSGNSVTTGRERYHIAETLLYNSLNQIYLFGSFHADLHPANIVLVDGSPVYLDFGIVGHIDRGVRESVVHYSASLFLGDVEGAAGELLSWVDPRSEGDSARARGDLIQLFREFLLAFKLSGAAPMPNSAAAVDVRILATLQQHNLVLRAEYSAYIKAVTTLNSVIFELCPRFPLEERIGSFFRRFLLPEKLAHVVQPTWGLAFWRTRRRMERLNFFLDELPLLSPRFEEKLSVLTRGLYTRLIVPLFAIGFIVLIVMLGGERWLRAKLEIGGLEIGVEWILLAAGAINIFLLGSSIRRVSEIRDLRSRGVSAPVGLNRRVARL